MLIHDNGSCPFPTELQQPPLTRGKGVFDDKAVTYMDSYSDYCARQVLKKSFKGQHVDDLSIFCHPWHLKTLLEISKINKLDINLLLFPGVSVEPFEMGPRMKNTSFNTIELRRAVANSRAVVVLLHSSMAQEPSYLNELLDLSILFSTRIYLIFDDKLELQPFEYEKRLEPNIHKVNLFGDTIIHWNQNLTTAIDDVILKEQKLGGCRGVIELKTRCFLSHKRSSAQGLTGRLFQELKHNYKIFLDSEAGTLLYYYLL